MPRVGSLRPVPKAAPEPSGVLAASQRAIVNVYTLIALAYCAASAWLFFAVVRLPVEGYVHALAFAIIAANYAVLQRTRDYDAATHAILAVGTLVVSSLYATGGWGGTGFLWTFAYLPYAFFLASERVAQLWVGVLVAVDLAILIADTTGAMAVPYGPVGHGMFYASLGVFLLCMFLFKREVLRSEALSAEQTHQLAQANEELLRREADLNTAQRVARLGSFLWDPGADRTAWTAPMAELFGLSPTDEPINLVAFRDVVHPADRGRFEKAWSALLRDGTPVELDCRITRRDGVTRTLHIRARPGAETLQSGRPILGTAQDVTEVRQAEEERRVSAVRLQELEGLKEVNRFKTQFINTAAHELATPLTPIRLQLHNLRADTRPERRQHAMDLLERNVARLGLLVQDLLDGARLQSNQLAIERKPVELAALVGEAVRNQTVVAQPKGVRIELEPSGGPMWTQGDARRLAQVVDNLLANAVKFTPEGKAVHVRCVHASGGVAVFVRDEGIGIDPRKQDRLFQPFSQVHDTSQQTRAGSGLGLYISKGIIEAHGGRIGMESQGLGHGATFWFVLGEGEAPAGQAPPPLSPATPPPNPPAAPAN